MDNSQVVAQHYNSLEEKGLKEREKSQIFHLRNFNNWIKSVLIKEFLQKIRDKQADYGKIFVLDIGAGKGGDLLKWQKGRISHLVCADIAQTSLEQCEARFRDMKNRNRHNDHLFTLETIAADCTKIRLKELYKNPNIKFDLISCQFTFHYSFESLPQARQMIQNAADCLKPGGYFIGTTPDAYDIIRRVRESNSETFGNDVFSISFEKGILESLPLFGAKYNFHLDTVVDCPEFLVYFPLFEELAKEYGLKLVFKKRFEDFFKDHLSNKDDMNLLNRMKALEAYPPLEDSDHGPASEYQHAIEKLKEVSKENAHWKRRVGTMSKSEWDALTLYIVFAFIKEKK